MLESPCRGETGDTAPDDHERNVGSCSLRNFDTQTIAQPVAEIIRRADDLSRWKRRHFVAPASRERKRNT